MSSRRFLFSNGVVSHSSDTPPVATFLETHPGAYTTTRTHKNGSCLLFWERHLQRLANSARILLNSRPHLMFSKEPPPLSLSQSPSLRSPQWESMMGCLVNDSVTKVLPVALEEMKRNGGEELAVTTLVSGDLERFNEIEDGERVSEVFDVFVHIGFYAVPVFGVRENGARLAVVGRGRDVAAAKYSEWVRLRKPLEKLRSPSVTELLLSNDGDQILEGCVTNFFTVCRKDNDKVEGKYLHDYQSTSLFEVQTAPISDGVLPGIVRQLVIEVCLDMGILLREIAPSWSERELWEEAFVTNSLRVIQHVETIQAPSSWESLESKHWNEISWEEKQFKGGPGMITEMIQKEIMERAAGREGCLSRTSFQ